MARRARQISLKECYEILQLKKGADLQAVKNAYRRRAFELHPDLNPGNAEAGRQFQLLNEAYVALSAMLKASEESRQRAEAKKSGKSSTTSQAGKSTAGAEKTEQKTAQTGSSTSKQGSEEKETSKASAAYAEQDVLRDLLNDPFAKRVFEDIYSEVDRQKHETAQEKPINRPVTEPAGKKPAKPKEAILTKPAPINEKSQEKGVTGVVKGWLRKQIDDQQSLVLPASQLGPGRRLRLQIRVGLSDEVKSVEVTLPPDFAPGKPIRLRKLGKHIGPWQGDLYLTINTE